MSVGANSRFNHTVRVHLINANGNFIEKSRLDIRPRLIRTISADSREFSPASNDNWSRIAWRFLGTGRLYWLIADYSNVVDPFKDLRPPESVQYLTQLTVDILAGEQTSMTVARPKELMRGDKVTVEDLSSGGNSVDVSILTVDNDTGVVTFPPTIFPVGGVPFLLSRVSKKLIGQVNLFIPSINEAVFQGLDFRDPLNTLVE